MNKIKCNENVKNKFLIIFLLFYIIIIFIFIFFEIINPYINLEKELNKIIEINNNTIQIQRFKKVNNPKISIISPIYNREKYLFRFLKNIQYQTFKDIEIIFVDDKSIDNSCKMIEEFKKTDKRIILIINKKNKGTFISRNLGVLYSKGKYVFLPDPDDMINKSILKLCYKYSEKYNFELIRFNIYKRNGKSSFNNNKYIQKPIYQPELSIHMFYGNNELQIIDYYIHNKFIKKDCFLRALNRLNKFYYNMYITIWEDTIISYILYREAKSYYFIKKIGYYYLKNSQSITKNMFKISELKLKFIFIFLKIVFENSKNNKYEKDMSNALFTELNRNLNIAYTLSTLSFISLSSNLVFYLNVIKMYISSLYITKENKNHLRLFKNIIKNIYIKNKYKK